LEAARLSRVDFSGVLPGWRKGVKTTTKKLILSRETLRNLEESTLRMPLGGAVTRVDCTQVHGSCVSTRPTCFCTAAVTCTTTI
jgi:hypothetical protein